MSHNGLRGGAFEAAQILGSANCLMARRASGFASQYGVARIKRPVPSVIGSAKDADTGSGDCNGYVKWPGITYHQDLGTLQ